MKRLVLNGSPRGHRSNSRIIISWIMDGFSEAGAAEPPVTDLARTRNLEEQRQAFLEAEEVLLVFPLYTDSVPAVVKGFIDSLEDADPARLSGKRLAIVVHSGFPESVHSEPVVRYLRRLCQRLRMICAGTAIKGGSEGFRVMPGSMTKKPRLLFTALGRGLAGEGRFPDHVTERLARPRRLSVISRILLNLLRLTGLANMYWKIMLKNHHAWERRFDRPYAEALPLRGE